MTKFIFLFFTPILSVFSSGVELETKRTEANQRDVISQYQLGFIYDEGEGVPQDFKQAVYWYEKSANHGDREAQYHLGVMFDHGRGVPQDYKQAVYWYKKSADQGIARAQYNLGVMHFLGHGVEKDPIEAYAWICIAGVYGEPVSDAKILVSKVMTSEQITKAKERFKRIESEIEGNNKGGN